MLLRAGMAVRLRVPVNSTLCVTAAAHKQLRLRCCVPALSSHARRPRNNGSSDGRLLVKAQTAARLIRRSAFSTTVPPLSYAHRLGFELQLFFMAAVPTGGLRITFRSTGPSTACQPGLRAQSVHVAPVGRPAMPLRAG